MKSKAKPKRSAGGATRTTQGTDRSAGQRTQEPRSRREKALETRRRMLKAAYDLFCEHGYAATTMDVIAKRADVAVQTLYFTFHTKAHILNECVGAAITGFDIWDPRAVPAVTNDPRQAFQDFHPWFPAFEKASTQLDALGVFIEASMAIFSRIAPLWVVMQSAATSDPELRALADIGEQRRVEGYDLVVELLAKRGGLRRGVTQKRGTDILLTVLSNEVYLSLVAHRGWSNAEARRFIVDVLAQQLLPPP